MRPVVIGAIVAALIIAAFVVGGFLVESDKGPAEEIGEKIDDATE